MFFLFVVSTGLSFMPCPSFPSKSVFYQRKRASVVCTFCPPVCFKFFNCFLCCYFSRPSNRCPVLSLFSINTTAFACVVAIFAVPIVAMIFTLLHGLSLPFGFPYPQKKSASTHFPSCTQYGNRTHVPRIASRLVRSMQSPQSRQRVISLSRSAYPFRY